MQPTDTKIINRRQFLRGDFSKKPEAIRPPWAIAEFDFVNTCTRCNECVEKCPENIIVKAEDGFPTINFDLGGCSFCQECVAACDAKALSIISAGYSPWDLKADISNDCISLHGVMCRSCVDSCDEDAITFQYRVGGVSQPELNQKSCTGCGFCVVTCPVDSIKISKDNTQEDYDYEHN
jgi:ferredoxin-type protein NapF